jgi:ketosteroid isomerase-like protein
VIATNVFIKTAQGWRLVAHHASPGSPKELQEVTEAPSVLH